MDKHELKKIMNELEDIQNHIFFIIPVEYDVKLGNVIQQIYDKIKKDNE